MTSVMVVAIICDVNHLISNYSECHLLKERRAAVTAIGLMSTAYQSLVRLQKSLLVAKPVVFLLELLILDWDA